jgi:putative glutathione S-transferase
MRDVYEKANATGTLYSVPVLWDKKLETIVSNESADITVMLNSEFNDFATKPDLDLAPKSSLKKMAEVDAWIYAYINNGAYRCGFAKSQEAYDDAIENFNTHMKKLDKHLAGKKKFLTGD